MRLSQNIRCVRTSSSCADNDVVRGKIAAISVARKLGRCCYHTLRSVDPDLVYAMAA
jgi:hypothetical protein